MRGRRTRGLIKRGSRRLRVFARERVVPRGVWNTVRRLVEKRPPPPSRADDLEAKLWRGYSAKALSDLEALLRSPSSTPREISDAARALACWYTSHDDHNKALQYTPQMSGRTTASSALRPMLEADCLMQLGEREKARQVLSAALARRPSSALYLAMANTHAEPERSISAQEDAERLAWLNEVYLADGLAPLAKLDASRPLTLDNLCAPTARPGRLREAPKVSVIVPTFDASKTLHVAIESLLAQTWTNLEIIIVDDVSSDGTVEIAKQYAARDSRVVVLQQSRNQGAYCARNRGLEHASGVFVTVHDADDWSHPEKLEKQALHLLKHPRALANLSVWARCLPHVYFRGATRASRPWVHFNHSSLMLKRQLLLELGGWDEVRIGSDSELLRRLRHGQTEERIPKVLRSAPLALALSAPESLTRQSVTHSNTLLHGVRRSYYEASLHWLAKQPPGPVRLPLEGRPFPAPKLMLPDRQTTLALDALFTLDFNVNGICYDRAMASIEALASGGAKVGVFQWPRYDSDLSRPLRAELLDLAHSGTIEIVSAGQHARVDVLYAADPLALQQAIDTPPELELGRAVLVEPDAAVTSARQKERASQILQQAFGATPTWEAPIAG